MPLRVQHEDASLIDRLLPDRGTADTFAANLANTVTPTMLTGGEAVNVIPGRATARLDGRLILELQFARRFPEVRDSLDWDLWVYGVGCVSRDRSGFQP